MQVSTVDIVFPSVARKAILACGVLLGASCAPPMIGPPPPPDPGPPPTPEAAPAAGLPPVPHVEGALAIRVVHPTPEMTRPNVRNTFIYGSVGTGTAMLTINGQRVDVYPNGAFLAFLPVPANGRWELVAEAGGRVERTSVSYRVAAAGAPAAAVSTESFVSPRAASVSGGADTLATGSDVTIGRPTPTGPYTWFLPRGARLHLTGQRGDQYRAALAPGLEAWFPARSIALGPARDPIREVVQGVGLQDAAEWTDVRIAATGAPFQVTSEAARLTVLLYDRYPPGSGGSGSHRTGSSDFVASPTWEAVPTGARLVIPVNGRLWGYKAFYEPDGTVVLRLRRPPPVDPNQPLRGIRIVVDPGHPPGGATGPTGLTEAEANLNIAIPLAEMLRARGADVLMTRTEHVAVSLSERVDQATRFDAHLLVSVHNNAFPEGVNPFQRHGTSTYYFHGHAVPLARRLQREIQAVTRIPDLGVISGNLAVARPTWMPAVLTESLFMPLPDQEAALRDRDFTYSVALAHLRAIESFLREP